MEKRAMKKIIMALMHCDVQYEFYNKLNPVRVLDRRVVYFARSMGKA